MTLHTRKLNLEQQIAELQKELEAVNTEIAKAATGTTRKSILANLGFNIDVTDEIITKLEKIGNKTSNDVLLRIKQCTYYKIYKNESTNEFTIVAQYGRFKYETKLISKLLNDSKFVQDGTIADRNGLWQQWRLLVTFEEIGIEKNKY